MSLITPEVMDYFFSFSFDLYGMVVEKVLSVKRKKKGWGLDSFYKSILAAFMVNWSSVDFNLSTLRCSANIIHVNRGVKSPRILQLSMYCTFSLKHVYTTDNL